MQIILGLLFERRKNFRLVKLILLQKKADGHYTSVRRDTENVLYDDCLLHVSAVY